MKKLLFLIFLLSLNLSYSQRLGIEETIQYINQKLGDRRSIEISEDGRIKFTGLIPEVWWNGESLSTQEFTRRMNSPNAKLITNYTYSFDIESVEILGYGYLVNYDRGIVIKCLDEEKCISYEDYDYKVKKRTGIFPQREKKKYLEIGLESKKESESMLNAFKYLSVLAKEKYQTKDLDPFSNKNYSETFSKISGEISKDEIKLRKTGNIYFIMASINGVNQEFVLDSGASELSLSEEFQDNLIAKGLLTKEDYLGPALYQLADGSIVAQNRFNLKKVTVGNFVIENIKASFGTKNSPFLLGKSFLDKFSSWSIDNEKNLLILNK